MSCIPGDERLRRIRRVRMLSCDTQATLRIFHHALRRIRRVRILSVCGISRRVCVLQNEPRSRVQVVRMRGKIRRQIFCRWFNQASVLPTVNLRIRTFSLKYLVPLVQPRELAQGRIVTISIIIVQLNAPNNSYAYGQ